MADLAKRRSKGLWLAVGVVAVAFVGAGIYVIRSLQPAGTAPVNNGGTSQATLTTLGAIVDGNFTSAVNKLGDGGSYVEIRDVIVFKVITEEADGDWHVYIRDPTYDQFISEIIPRDQAAEGQPPLNVPLFVWGITYCDVPHQNDGWHGYTCWEIHPLTSWATM
jgi:hypothetical protein